MVRKEYRGGWAAFAVFMLLLFLTGVKEKCDVREVASGKPGSGVGQPSKDTCVEGQSPMVCGMERPYLLCSWWEASDHRVQGTGQAQGVDKETEGKTP